MARLLRGKAPPQRHSSGQAMVEMALVCTIFLSIVLGIAEFGRAFMVLNALTTASRESARFASVRPNLVTNDPQVLDRARTVLRDAGVDITDFGLVVTNNRPASRGELVKVTVRLPNYKPMTGAAVPFLGLLSTFTLEETTTMRWEG